MGKYVDDHIPTCMLNNEMNLPSHMMTPLLHMKVLGHPKCWLVPTKTLSTLVKFNFLH